MKLPFGYAIYARVTRALTLLCLFLPGPAFAQTTPSFSFANSTAGAGLYSSSANKINLVTVGTSALTVDTTNFIGIGTTAPKTALEIAAVGTAGSAILVPRDTTANRPTGVNGMIRYATDTGAIEAYQAGAWTSLSASGGGTSFACPTNFTAVTSTGARFCINTTSYDNASGASLGSGSTSNVATLVSDCTGNNGYVCSFAQLYAANAASLIHLGTTGGTGGTYNGNGAWTSESVFYPDAINFNQNSSYCPYINGSGALATVQCSQARSLFCCR